MPVLNPGFAIASALENFMIKKKAEERQAILEAQADRKFQLELENIERKRKFEDEDREERRLDKERAKLEKETSGMVIGDIPTPDQVARSRRLGVPLRTDVAPPSPVEVTPPGIIQELSPNGVSGETPVAEMPAGAIRFAGDPAQVKEAQQKAAQQRFIESLTGSQAQAPGRQGTGAAQSAAARSVGLPMSAADFEPPAPPSKSAALQEYEFYKAEETAAGRQPLGFDAYQARDANRKRPVTPVPLPGGMDPKVMNVAITLGKALTSDPVYRDMLDIQTGRIGVEQGLSRKTGFGDIAAINAFQRMADPGATVREGDVKLLQSANAFIEKMNPTYWIARLEKGDKLPEATRTEMLGIAKELYKVRARNYDQMTGKKFKRLAKEAGIDFSLIGEDFGEIGSESAASTPAGVPKVGDTFMGGKVVSIE